MRIWRKATESCNMKKRAVLLCALGFACAASLAQEAADHNVVGFQAIQGVAGFNVIAPTFVLASSEPGTNGVWTLDNMLAEFSDFDSLQMGGPDGNVTNTLYWFNTETMGLPSGWYRQDPATDEWAPADASFGAGTAVFLVLNAPVTVLFHGLVKTDAVTLPLKKGFNAMGGARPYLLTFGDIQWPDLSDFDSVQFPDATGRIVFQAMWLTEAFTGVSDAWYDVLDGGDADMDIELPPGGGFYFYHYLDGDATATVPGPHSDWF
jgi:hypothetical protein